MSARLKLISAFAVISLLFAVDRLLKIFFINYPATWWWDNFLVSFRLAKNYGIAFGFALPQWLLGLAVFIALLAIIIWLAYCLLHKQWLNSLALWLIFCGAFSNILDRLRYGFVVDYIDVRFFTILNIADIMITLGAVWLGWMLIMPKKKDKKVLEF